MKSEKVLKPLYFFPGCTLTSTAKENYYFLYLVCKNLGFRLIELDDWNCCGTSSAHSLNPDLAIDLALRNIALAKDVDTLLVACPTCFLRLKIAHFLTKNDPSAQKRFFSIFNTPFPSDLKIVPVLKFLEENTKYIKKKVSLNKIKFAPYYGCMLNIPPMLKKEVKLSKVMESLLETLGGIQVVWGLKSVCCGTFLSVVKPHSVTEVVNKIFLSAMESGAECLVTACSMCHLNLEMRCSLKRKIPVFHFSELIAISIGRKKHLNWFRRHIINPVPLLEKKGLF